MTTYDQWDVVVTLFPFVDAPVLKSRPALVLSRRTFNQAHDLLIIAMITTAAAGRWPDDHEIIDLEQAGLRHSSVVRWKIYTVPARIVTKSIGVLGEADREGLRERSRLVLW